MYYNMKTSLRLAPHFDLTPFFHYPHRCYHLVPDVCVWCYAEPSKYAVVWIDADDADDVGHVRWGGVDTAAAAGTSAVLPRAAAITLVLANLHQVSMGTQTLRRVTVLQ